MRQIFFLLPIVMLFSLIPLAYADVTSVMLKKDFYTTDEKITFIGTQDGKDTVFVIINSPTAGYKGMVSDPSSFEDKFETIPRDVNEFFDVEGTYIATAFSGDQKQEEGVTIQLEFDGSQVTEITDFILQIQPISDKTIQETKTLTFTVQLTRYVEDVVYSLEKNPPAGATINSSTGKFTWTPTASQGPGSYTFDIVATKNGQVDRESITVKVTEPKPPIEEPKEEPKEELEIPAPFVDSTLDPQYYVDRYFNEPKYKEWFDENYPEYDSIYQAVGLSEPIPNWVKGVFKFWADGQISDEELKSAIRFLVNEGIIIL